MRYKIEAIHFKRESIFIQEKERIKNHLFNDTYKLTSMVDPIKGVKFFNAAKKFKLKNSNVYGMVDFITNYEGFDIELFSKYQKNKSIPMLTSLAELIKTEDTINPFKSFSQKIKKTGYTNPFLEVVFDNPKQVIIIKKHYYFESEAFDYLKKVCQDMVSDYDGSNLLSGVYSEDNTYKQTKGKTTILENILDKKLNASFKSTKSLDF